MQRHFEHGTQDESDNKSDERELEFLHEIPENSESDHHTDRKKTVVCDVGSGYTDEYDYRINNTARYGQDPDKDPQTDGADKKIKDIADQHAAIDAIYQPAVFFEHQRSRRDPVDNKSTDQHG